MSINNSIYYPVNHYENFPVASLLLPRHLRKAVSTLYQFARSADDLADEGEISDEKRLEALQHYRHQLDLISQQQRPTEALFVNLAVVIAHHKLPLQPFYDLLSAFSQDVTTKRYETLTDVLDYCSRSANPIGTLMLHLYQAQNAQHQEWSNQICSGLQLTNFWQDVMIDLKKGRIYIPLADLRAFQVHAWEIEENYRGSRWQKLMRYEIGRTRAMLHAGLPLGHVLRGRIGLELRMMIQGGLRILEKLEACDIDLVERRPVLTKRDWCVILWRALTTKQATRQATKQAT